MSCRWMRVSKISRSHAEINANTNNGHFTMLEEYKLLDSFVQI